MITRPQVRIGFAGIAAQRQTRAGRLQQSACIVATSERSRAASWNKQQATVCAPARGAVSRLARGIYARVLQWQATVKVTQEHIQQPCYGQAYALKPARQRTASARCSAVFCPIWSWVSGSVTRCMHRGRGVGAAQGTSDAQRPRAADDTVPFRAAPKLVGKRLQIGQKTCPKHERDVLQPSVALVHQMAPASLLRHPVGALHRKIANLQSVAEHVAQQTGVIRLSKHQSLLAYVIVSTCQRHNKRAAAH